MVGAGLGADGPTRSFVESSRRGVFARVHLGVRAHLEPPCPILGLVPGSGMNSSASYRLRPDARQFVVIAAGGNPLTGTGDALLAFALPE